MADWHANGAIILLVLQAATTSVQACSCGEQPSLQEVFCSSNYVIKATVSSMLPRLDAYANKVYNVDVLHVYKTNGTQMVQGQTSRISTPAVESVCGVNLMVNTTYLLAGVSFDGRDSIYLCGSMYTDWNSVSTEEREDLDTSILAGKC